MELYLHVKSELLVAEGLIFRENRIVLPEKSRKKIEQVGHSMATWAR